jgi:prepilin-type N-terminal cleavage/methylation domain-containing protein
MKTLSSVLKKRVKAYTLTEILVVLIIIGILVLLVLPNLLPLITKAKSLEAKTQLTHLHPHPLVRISNPDQNSQRICNSRNKTGFLVVDLNKPGIANPRML